jgi:hypothetical protein
MVPGGARGWTWISRVATTQAAGLRDIARRAEDPFLVRRWPAECGELADLCRGVAERLEGAAVEWHARV